MLDFKSYDFKQGNETIETVFRVSTEFYWLSFSLFVSTYRDIAVRMASQKFKKTLHEPRTHGVTVQTISLEILNDTNEENISGLQNLVKRNQRSYVFVKSCL